MLLFLFFNTMCSIIQSFFVYPTLVSLIGLSVVLDEYRLYRCERVRRETDTPIHPSRRSLAMSPLKMSIVVCSYNKSAYLRRTLESLIGQRGVKPDEFEIIVVDGASTDGSAAVIREYARHFAWRRERAGPLGRPTR